jgi:hypothetical protein
MLARLNKEKGRREDGDGGDEEGLSNTGIIVVAASSLKLVLLLRGESLAMQRQQKTTRQGTTITKTRQSKDSHKTKQDNSKTKVETPQVVETGRQLI